MSEEQNAFLSSRYPKLVREFAEANFDLKTLAAISLSLLFLALVLIVFLIRSGPEVIALEPSGRIARIETKITDLQIQAAAEEYVALRYSWDEQTISSRLKEARAFVYPSLFGAFEKGMAQVVKYVKEKKVTQRVYPRVVKVNVEKKRISMVLDRFTQFDGLKAATEMQLELDFTFDSRTVVNPWGIYITKETEGGIQ